MEIKGPRQEKIQLDFIRTKEELRTKLEEHRKLIETKVLKFYEDKMISLEIVRPDNDLERIFFYKLPFFDSLTKDIKTKFNNEVNRMSCKTKCSDLQKKRKNLIAKIKREYQIRRFKVLKLVSDRIPVIRRLAFFLVLIINILILISFRKEEETDTDNKNAINQYVIPMLGIILILFTIGIVAYNIYQRVPIIMMAWEGFNRQDGNIFKVLDRTFKMVLNIFRVSTKIIF